jgi:hypothetical protein
MQGDFFSGDLSPVGEKNPRFDLDPTHVGSGKCALRAAKANLMLDSWRLATYNAHNMP